MRAVPAEGRATGSAAPTPVALLSSWALLSTWTGPTKPGAWRHGSLCTWLLRITEQMQWVWQLPPFPSLEALWSADRATSAKWR